MDSISAINELLPIDLVPFTSTIAIYKGQPVAERFKVPLVITKIEENLIAVSIGAFTPTKDISAPSSTGLVTLVISVAVYMLETVSGK